MVRKGGGYDEKSILAHSKFCLSALFIYINHFSGGMHERQNKKADDSNDVTCRMRGLFRGLRR